MFATLAAIVALQATSPTEAAPAETAAPPAARTAAPTARPRRNETRTCTNRARTGSIMTRQICTTARGDAAQQAFARQLSEEIGDRQATAWTNPNITTD